MKDLNNKQIEEETQNELRELFNELFVSKLLDELNAIKGKKTEIENSDKIFSDIKKSIDNLGNAVEDRINSFIELISFLGNEYEDIDEEYKNYFESLLNYSIKMNNLEFKNFFLNTYQGCNTAKFFIIYHSLKRKKKTA